jgi:hypothetical protein
MNVVDCCTVAPFGFGPSVAAVLSSPPSAPSGRPAGANNPRGDVVKWLNTEVCKTSIHRFESDRRLQSSTNWGPGHTPEAPDFYLWAG